MSLLCPYFYYFICVTVSRDDKSELSVVALYYIQQNEWLLEWSYLFGNAIDKFHYTETDVEPEGA